MKVEQENFLLAMLRSVQRRRSASGTSVRHRVRRNRRSPPPRRARCIARRGAHADRAAALEQRSARPARRAGCARPGRRATRAIAVHHRAAAAARMPDAELVFHEGQDGEQARAAERRHAEIFALEREGEPHARIAEVARRDRDRPSGAAAAAAARAASPGAQVAQAVERRLPAPGGRLRAWRGCRP